MSRVLCLYFQIVLVLVFLSNELNAETCDKPSIIPPCPEGWQLTPQPRSCVRQSHARHNWEDARDFCRKNHSDLLVISGAELNNYMSEYIRNQGFGDVWLGLTDKEKEGTWRWQLGKDKTGELVHNQWKNGVPKNDISLNCAIYLLMSEKWESRSCNKPHNFLCEYTKNDKDDPCNDGWKVFYSSDRCVKSPKKKLPYPDAVKMCKEEKARILTLPHASDAKSMKIFMIEYHRGWMGLNDIAHENKWVWLTGLKMSGSDFEKWGSNEPEGGRRENCAFINHKGNWFDTPCIERNGIICQTEAQDEAGNTQMHINYHRPDNKVFLDQPVEITCTADNTGGILTWAVTSKGGKTDDLPSHNMETKYVLVKNREGLCVNRTVSVMVTKAESDLDGAQFSCFAKPQKKKKKCRKISNSLRSCAISAELDLVDGARALPTLNVYVDNKLKGKGKGKISVKEGQTVMFYCKASVGLTGDNAWVVYLSKSPPELVQNTDIKRVTNHLKTFDKDTNSEMVQSKLSFPMRSIMSGIYAACFSYKLDSFTENLTCLETNKYCIKSPQLYMIKKNDENSVMSAVSYFLLFLLLVAVAVAFFIGRRWPIGGHGEGEGIIKEGNLEDAMIPEDAKIPEDAQIPEDRGPLEDAYSAIPERSSQA